MGHSKAELLKKMSTNPWFGNLPLVERKAMFEHVAVRMQKLTPKERECIVLKVLEGKSYREIDDITGISVSNVGLQIHNGLKRLSAFVGGNRS